MRINSWKLQFFLFLLELNQRLTGETNYFWIIEKRIKTIISLNMILLNRKVKMKSVQTIAEIAVKASGPHLKVFT